MHHRVCISVDSECVMGGHNGKQQKLKEWVNAIV